MMNWRRLLQEKLGLMWLPLRAKAVPFGIEVTTPDVGGQSGDWMVHSLVETGADHWVLRAHTAGGLEAEWHAQFFPGTRAMECWGSIRNGGGTALRHISELRPLDLEFSIEPDVGLPWVRSINGVRFVPKTFPPHDFACVDRQLLRLRPPHDYACQINCTGQGRSSAENLPVLLMTDEKQKHGLAAFLEWSGMWYMRWQLQTGGCETSYAPDARLLFTAAMTGLDLHMQPGESLPLPRILFCAFDGDLNAGGNALRRHIRRHVTPPLGGREVVPPTSFNHWFAFENNYTAELLKPAVQASAEAGLEYFCVDGGWFSGGFRDGIGNWSEGAPERFPQGIKPFSNYVRSHGLLYGTWFEPEWAHADSELYRAHPEWFWPNPHPSRSSESVYRLMNFGLPIVREWWLQRFIRAYEEWGMRWVRWDFNQEPRSSWEHGAAPGVLGRSQIEHITGLYATLDNIKAACPELLMEQCASGGHRIDLGMVRRGHTFWMNDHTVNTDIIRFLQQGLNMVLPGNYQNTNLCQDRHNFTDYDFLSHGAGGLGYSGKLWEAAPADFRNFKEAISRFKEYRHVLMGDFHRPTGQPVSYDAYSEVIFREGAEELRLEYNVPGATRAARYRLASLAAAQSSAHGAMAPFPEHESADSVDDAVMAF